MAPRKRVADLVRHSPRLSLADLGLDTEAGIAEPGRSGRARSCRACSDRAESYWTGRCRVQSYRNLPNRRGRDCSSWDRAGRGIRIHIRAKLDRSRHTSFGTADGVRRIDRDPDPGRVIGQHVPDHTENGLVLDGLPEIDFRCREFSCLSDSEGRSVEIAGQTRVRTGGRESWGTELAARGGQSLAIERNLGARKQDERKSHRPPSTPGCRKIRRARRHFGQRPARRARRERLRPGTSWPYSTPDWEFSGQWTVDSSSRSAEIHAFPGPQVQGTRGTHFLWTGESGLRARLGSCSPTLAGRTRTRLGWGTHVLWVGSGRSSKIVR